MYPENMTYKLVPDAFLVFVNDPKQSIHATLLKIRYFERGLSKIIQKVNFIFPLHLVSLQTGL